MKNLIILTLMFISPFQGHATEQDSADREVARIPHPIPLSRQEINAVAAFLKQPADQMSLDVIGRLKSENPTYFQNSSQLEGDLERLEAALPGTCDQERLRLLKVFCGWRKYNQNQRIPENLEEAAQSWAGEMAAWHFKGFLESSAEDRV